MQIPMQYNVVIPYFNIFIFSSSTSASSTLRNAQLNWDLILFYFLLFSQKTTQGDMSELFCKISINNVPDPNISGLDPSERIVSIYSHIQAFLPHFKRVYEQQTDLQLPTNTLMTELTRVSNRSSSLAAMVNCIYQSLFPNMPVPEPAGGPTSLPPSQNIFQQKVYGCVVLKRYKEFLSNVARELRTVKNQVCKKRTQMNVLSWGWPKAGPINFHQQLC